MSLGTWELLLPTAPQVGWSTGWVGLIVVGWLVLRKLSNGEWVTKPERDRQIAELTAAHEERITELKAAQERELERVEHDRGEWRAESRIKDAQMAEMSTQLTEKDRQLSSLASIGDTVESLVIALRQTAAGGEAR